MCASLAEEAAAIGWYVQRIAADKDAEALAIMEDSLGQKFKHFNMELELLLRKTHKLCEAAIGVLFQDGDSVKHGEAAEGAAR
jgi:hypothetical protein